MTEGDDEGDRGAPAAKGEQRTEADDQPRVHRQPRWTQTALEQPPWRQDQDIDKHQPDQQTRNSHAHAQPSGRGILSHSRMP